MIKVRSGGLVLALPLLTFIALFFFVPMGLILGQSVLGYASGRVVFDFTAKHYISLFADGFYQWILWRTMLQSAATTLFCVVLGYPVALGIARAGHRWRPVLLGLIVAPLLIGGVVRSYGWMLILDSNGLLNNVLVALGVVSEPLQILFTVPGVVVSMVEVLLPFFILPLVGVLSNMNPELENASMSMGASRLQTFVRVTLPLSMPGVIAGASIVFSLALALFVVPRIIGGPSYLVLSTLAYQQISNVGNMPFGAAISATMLLLNVLTLVLINRAAASRARRLAGA